MSQLINGEDRALHMRRSAQFVNPARFRLRLAECGEHKWAPHLHGRTNSQLPVVIITPKTPQRPNAPVTHELIYTPSLTHNKYHNRDYPQTVDKIQF